MSVRLSRAALRRAAKLAPAALLLAAAAAVLLGAAPRARPLAATDAGQGEPCFVLVPGLGVDRTVWDVVAKRLEAGHRVLAVDLPGHGQSVAIDSVRVERIAEALDATLEARGIKKAILVGHSYGGLVALAEAAAHGRRAAGVVVVDIGAYNPVDPERVAEMDQFMTQHYAIFVPAVFQTMSADSSVRESLTARARAVPQAVLTAYFHDAWRADLRPSMRRLDAPLLVVAGSRLWPAGEPWDSVQANLGYGGARRASGVRIADSVHFIPLDQPDSLAAALETFAARLR